MNISTLAIRLTRFFMRFAGFWIWEDKRGKLLMDLAMGYTIIAIITACGITGSDLWYSKENFNVSIKIKYHIRVSWQFIKFGEIIQFGSGFGVSNRSSFQQGAYAACNAMTVLVILLKLVVFTIKRKAFINLIEFSYKHFWNRDYDTFGQSVVKDCNIRCVYFVCMFTFFAQCTVCSYTIHPIIENIGKNETDRTLVFNIYLDIPKTTTPYYEVIFFIEILALAHSGICYFCFDNLLCIMIVHTSGQFRILQKRLETIYDEWRIIDDRFDSSEKLSTVKARYDRYSINASNEFYQFNEFKEWVRNHQTLIGFVEMVERVYTFVILGQVVLFSLLICLVSYQAVLADGTISRRMIFIVHSCGTFTQLFMFTLTCDDLMRQSASVADAAYSAKWESNISNSASRKLAKNLIFVIMRTTRPCCLTAGGFFPISLETFRTILSTSMSYLTLLRRGQDSTPYE